MEHESPLIDVKLTRSNDIDVTIGIELREGVLKLAAGATVAAIMSAALGSGLLDRVAALLE